MSPDFEYLTRETELPFGSDRDGVVTATLEEIRYADALRARLRDMLLPRASPAPIAELAGTD